MSGPDLSGFSTRELSSELLARIAANISDPDIDAEAFETALRSLRLIVSVMTMPNSPLAPGAGARTCPARMRRRPFPMTRADFDPNLNRGRS